MDKLFRDAFDLKKEALNLNSTHWSCRIGQALELKAPWAPLHC